MRSTFILAVIAALMASAMAFPADFYDYASTQDVSAYDQEPTAYDQEDADFDTELPSLVNDDEYEQEDASDDYAVDTEALPSAASEDYQDFDAAGVDQQDDAADEDQEYYAGEDGAEDQEYQQEDDFEQEEQ
jgi:hypothetical protein